jgi:hypothetical protein
MSIEWLTTSESSHLGGRGEQTSRHGQLETRVAMAVWLCSTSDGETYWWVLKESPDRVPARRTRARMSTPSCLVES